MKQLKLIIIFIVLSISLVACQAPKDKTQGWTSASGEVRPGPKTGKAVLALLSKARQASTKGSLSTAESHLERALRIEPHNPSLWLYMAKLRLFAAKSKEAINLAKKALALSSRGGTASRKNRRSLQADCWQVIAHAQQKMGNLTKAQKAQDKAKSLSD
jgi:tetratricopeptide (TPR) repeat protein